ncbi:MAG: hypothetical protein J6I45_05285, partial [Clostridia bacterium]|nr:hypothetical protein [Clostridia bacterium]
MMKQHTRFLLLLFLSFVIALFFSCEKSGGHDGTDTSADQPEAVDNLLIGGSNTYTIIRPDVSGDEVVDASVRLRKAIEAVSGGEVSMGTDWVKKGESVPEDAYEILIGETNRTASAKVM